jgi:hypothetical protein
MTTTKQHDFLNRLLSISSAVSGLPSPFSFAYTLNAANQRSAVHLADGSYWVYGYDNLGQLTTAKKYWPDGTPAAGQQFEYNFDDIGNRTTQLTTAQTCSTSTRTATFRATSISSASRSPLQA